MSKAGEPIKQHTHRNINQGGPLDPDIIPGFHRPAVPMLKGDCEGCPEYYCVSDTEVPFTGDGGFVEMSTDDGNEISAETIHLYAGCTYRIDHTFVHSAGSNDVQAWLRPVGGGGLEYGHVYAGGRCGGTYSNFESGTGSPPTGDYEIDLQGQFFIGCSTKFTTDTVRVFFVSGPDPRFETPCPIPKLGQPVRQIAFLGDGTTTTGATDWHYMPNSLSIFVNGLDWIALVTESNPATGTYEVAIPFPVDATVTLRYRRAA